MPRLCAGIDQALSAWGMIRRVRDQAQQFGDDMKASEIDWPLVTRIRLRDGTQIPIAFGSAELDDDGPGYRRVIAMRADMGPYDDDAEVEIDTCDIAWVGRGGLASFAQIIGELAWTADDLRMLAGEDVERWRNAEGVVPQATSVMSRADELERERLEEVERLARIGGEGRHAACVHPDTKKANMNCRQNWRRKFEREYQEETAQWLAGVG